MWQKSKIEISMESSMTGARLLLFLATKMYSDDRQGQTMWSSHPLPRRRNLSTWMVRFNPLGLWTWIGHPDSRPLWLSWTMQVRTTESHDFGGICFRLKCGEWTRLQSKTFVWVSRCRECMTQQERCQRQVLFIHWSKFCNFWAYTSNLFPIFRR